MTVLDEIILGVKADLADRKALVPDLHEEVLRTPKPIDALTKFTPGALHVIAEVKRASPSKGDLAEISDPVALAKSYADGGATAISVLTEQRRFKGSLADFKAVRAAVTVPMLQKDFVVDSYQIDEGFVAGGNLFLLIVAALNDEQLRGLFEYGETLGLRALVEVHNQEELERATALKPSFIGVNSRNLKDLSVDFQTFEKLIPQIDSSIIAVAESGIASRSETKRLEELGAKAILVGETLVKAQNPIAMIRELRGI
ncbi:MAG: indole-3-glycerol phosphate synthase TrpC [Actinobacteria bacterium]|uniref:indole-3-glycerol-phosphate synthase n=1 Tax=freshwater metagenome TaxID=449393 RepID=A0A6J6GSV8_9ZZZZ|nr:indole-3-glycerol phosphate synthase TrpC [Actinomycetota bacterium]